MDTPGMDEHGERPPMAVAAEEPDAAPRAGDDAVRIAVHVAVILAVLALLAYCVIWAPRQRSGGEKAAAARVDYLAMSGAGGVS